MACYVRNHGHGCLFHGSLNKGIKMDKGAVIKLLFAVVEQARRDAEGRDKVTDMERLDAIHFFTSGAADHYREAATFLIFGDCVMHTIDETWEQRNRMIKVRSRH